MAQYKVKLTTLSPLHIGSGRVLSYNTEYLNFPQEGVCVVIDEKKVLDIIGQDNIDKWVSIIENQEDLLDYLTKRKPDLKPEDVAKRIIHGKIPANSRVGLREQLFAGNGRPLLPGSSLKGPIRTAYFNTQLETRFSENGIPNKYLLYQDELDKKANGKLQQELIGKNPNHDLFRFVRVYDVTPQVHTEVYPGVLMNYDIRNEEWYKDQRPMHFVEVLPKGTEMELLIELQEPPNQFKAPFSSIDNMFAQVNGVTSAATALDHDDTEMGGSDHADAFVDQMATIRSHVDNAETSRECVMRVGYGSGWLFMTGRWPYDEDLVEDDIFNMIKDAVQGKDYPEEAPFPKTRKLLEGGQPLGFVKLEKSE